jgi:hypothetical protein
MLKSQILGLILHGRVTALFSADSEGLGVRRMR